MSVGAHARGRRAPGTLRLTCHRVKAGASRGLPLFRGIVRPRTPLLTSQTVGEALMQRSVTRRAVWYGAIAWLVLSGLISGSSASPTPIPGALFGPEDFIRQRGGPSPITRTFSVAHP